MSTINTKRRKRAAIPMGYFSYKLEKIKKDRNIENYKHILPFLNE
jgi:hypothetical protein